MKIEIFSQNLWHIFISIDLKKSGQHENKELGKLVFFVNKKKTVKFIEQQVAASKLMKRLWKILLLYSGLNMYRCRLRNLTCTLQGREKYFRILFFLS